MKDFNLTYGCSGFFFSMEAFRMNEQAVSEIPFKGDWGCFPNKQICEDCTEGKIEKMSEPVQVYTACQFVYRLKTSPEAVSTAIIQSIPSPKAEPFKRWLAQVGRERIEETIDPEQAIDRALETYQKKGYGTDWIHQRLLSIRVRNELTAEWQERGVQQGKEYIKQKETADQGPP